MSKRGYLMTKNHKESISRSNRKYFINENFFSTYTPQSCYWAGFIAADGCILKPKCGNPVLSLHLAKRDKGHLRLFLVAANSNYPVKIYKNRSPKIYYYCSLQIRNKKLVDDLKINFNIISRKSLILKYPIQMPNKFNKYFIRGYFDGDGCICLNSDRRGDWKKQLVFVISCASYDFLSIVQSILISQCFLTQTKILKKRNNNFQLVYGGNKQVPRIMKFLSVPFALPRKNISSL